MQNLKFKIEIPASPEKIWEALWDDLNYRKWAAVYFEGSFMKVEKWEQGATVQFLDPDLNGIYSEIKVLKQNSSVTFQHIASVSKGQNQPVDENSKKWTGTTEKYQIVQQANNCLLSLELGVMDEHIQFMSEKTPEALKTIAAICTVN